MQKKKKLVLCRETLSRLAIGSEVPKSDTCNAPCTTTTSMEPSCPPCLQSQDTRATPGVVAFPGAPDLLLH